MTAQPSFTAIPVRADGVSARLARRLADECAENTRLRRALTNVSELAEEELGEWLSVQVPYLPERLMAVQSIYCEAEDALNAAGVTGLVVTIEPETNIELRQVTE